MYFGAFAEFVARMEEHYLACPDSGYIPDFWHRILLVARFLSLFEIVVVTCWGGIEHSLPFVVLTLGLWVGNGLIAVIQALTPTLPSLHTCTHVLTNRVADDAATVWIVFVYYLVYFCKYTYVKQRGRIRCSDYFHLVTLLGLTVLSCVGLYSLGVYTLAEVWVGSLIGVAVGAGVSSLLYEWILYRWETRGLLHKFLKAFQLRSHFFPDDFLSDTSGHVELRRAN